MRTESLLEQFSRKYNPQKHAMLLQALHSPHTGAGKTSITSQESAGFTKLGQTRVQELVRDHQLSGLAQRASPPPYAAVTN